MKELIIGIDGGDHGILSRMPTPYLHKLFTNEQLVNLTEDLLSRGWAEILSGAHAKHTKALYMMPLMDGTPSFSGRFSLDDMLKNHELTPIWEVPERKGSKVGIMNVPTTFPAPKVDGFFVSGAGGGVNKVDGIPEELCYPKSLVHELAALDYVIDLRFGTAGITDIQILFEKLNLMMENRVKTFLKLCKQHTPEFGFLVIRAPTVIQYLAMSEIERYFLAKEGKLSAEEKKNSQVWFENFEKHYQKLDSLIQHTFEVLKPEHWILTADHGAIPYRYKMDVNAFLIKHDYYRRSLKPVGTIKSYLKNILSPQRRQHFFTANWKNTKAFGHWYLSGIMVNDQKRFGGPVQDSEIPAIVEDICSKFNSTREAVQFEMLAKPYRLLHIDSKYSDYLPDIKIHCPETIFSVPNNGNQLIRENEFYGPLPDLTKVTGGMVTGQKSCHPLFCCDVKTSHLIKENDSKDLTIVYKLTERIFNS